MRLKTVYQFEGVEAATKKQLRDAQRETWKEVGEEWHAKFKAVKFTKRGATKYKYAPRSGDPGSGRRFKGSYQESKLKRRRNNQGERAIGEVKPLVFTGKSRSLAMASNKVTAKATSFERGYVDIIVNAPALNFKNPNSKTNPRDEVTRTVPQDIDYLTRFGNDRFAKNVLAIQAKKTVS